MMPKIITLVQGSPEWHAHRAVHRNASEAAAVMGENPWMTPYQLWMIRTKRAIQPITPPMRHGTQLEPSARAAYEALTGNVVQPLVLVSEQYSASLDGLTLDGRLMIEIKCPYTGRKSALWKEASEASVPRHYWWQLQHQLMVSEAEEAHFFVFDGTGGLLNTVHPDKSAWRALREAWDRFMSCLRHDIPPELTERDSQTRSDPEWVQAAESYLSLKEASDNLDTELETAKARLIALAEHPSVSGAGVKVTRFWKQGTVDYKRVPALQGVDLDSYRGKGRLEVRVNVVK